MRLWVLFIKVKEKEFLLSRWIKKIEKRCSMTVLHLLLHHRLRRHGKGPCSDDQDVARDTRDGNPSYNAENCT